MDSCVTPHWYIYPWWNPSLNAIHSCHSNISHMLGSLGEPLHWFKSRLKVDHRYFQSLTFISRNDHGYENIPRPRWQHQLTLSIIRLRVLTSGLLRYLGHLLCTRVATLSKFEVGLILNVALMTQVIQKVNESGRIAESLRRKLHVASENIYNIPEWIWPLKAIVLIPPMSTKWGGDFMI